MIGEELRHGVLCAAMVHALGGEAVAELPTHVGAPLREVGRQQRRIGGGDPDGDALALRQGVQEGVGGLEAGRDITTEPCEGTNFLG